MPKGLVREGLGLGLTGKLDRAWVGAWVGAWVVYGYFLGWEWVGVSQSRRSLAQLAHQPQSCPHPTYTE